MKPKQDTGVDSEDRREEEVEHEVEDILDAQRGSSPNGRISYFVKWKGYDCSVNSWVDEQDAKNAGALIAKFWKKNPQKAREMGVAKPQQRSRNSMASEGIVSSAGGEARSLLLLASDVFVGTFKVPEILTKLVDASVINADTDSDIEHAEVKILLGLISPANVDPKNSPINTTEKHVDEDSNVGIVSGDDLLYEGWEGLVDKVLSIERKSDGSLSVSLLLKSGEIMEESEETCQARLPQKASPRKNVFLLLILTSLD
ncbi:hypothetical protein J132_10737 [Termitomyces sp. J132]|nr:hypothetical protein J132_10737 [Termitomyces sp. J132]